MDQRPIDLHRTLGLKDTTALVVGTIIGTGVFLKTARMAQETGSPTLVMLAWVVAGLLSLAGALTYAELGAMLPRAGGEYVFLQTAYGNMAGFLFGWMRFMIGSAGSIASFGVAFAIFLSALVPLDAVWVERTFRFLGQEIRWQFGIKQIVAVSVILFFCGLNGLKVAFGGRIQLLLTSGKVLGIAAVIIGVFFFAPNATWKNLTDAVPVEAVGGFAGFAAAMMAALWAYDGWNNMPMVAGEVRDPGRNVPRALILGMAIVLTIYGLVNLAYIYALPFNEIVTSSSTLFGNNLPVVSKAAVAFLGENGPKFVSIAVLLSVIGVLNGSILTSARIPYAMARDGVFFRGLAELNTQRVPVKAVFAQGAWACVLALSATFDQLTDAVVFAGLIFYAACAVAVIKLRYTMPNAERPYKTAGYPWVPIAFVVVATWLLVNTLVKTRVESAFGLAMTISGIPVYYFFKRRQKPSA
jgi:APA family basic amino acid/polyamine antiporter